MYWTVKKSLAQLLALSLLCLTVQMKAEEVVVVSESAPVLVGNTKIAEVQRGERFDVLQRSGPWVAIRLESSGKTHKGWVFANSLQSLADQQQAPPTPTAVAPGVELDADSIQVSLQGNRVSLAFRLRVGNASQAMLELDADKLELAIGDERVKSQSADVQPGTYYPNEPIFTRLNPNGQVQTQWLQPDQLLSKRSVRPGERVEGWLRFALPMLNHSSDFSDLDVALMGTLAGEDFALDLKELAINQLNVELFKADFDPSVPVISLHSSLNALNIHSVKQLLDIEEGDKPQCVLRIHTSDFYVDPFGMRQLGGNQGRQQQNNPYIFVLPESANTSHYTSGGSYHSQSLQFARSEREAAIMILGEQAEKIPLLLTYLDHEEPDVRRTVASTLALHSHLSQVSDHLIEAASDADPSVRSTALMALVGTSNNMMMHRQHASTRQSQQLSPKAIAVIVKGMEDMDVGVRSTAARIAARANASEIVQALIRLLNDENQTVVVAACNSLGALKANSATKALETLRQVDNPQTRPWAIRALGTIGGLTPLEAAVAQLSEGTPDYNDIRILEAEKDKRSVEPLIKYLSRPSDHQQYVDQVARILGDLGDPRATQVLLQQLKFGNAYSPEVPRALGKLGDESVIEPLREAGQQRHIQQPREVAVYEALIRLGDEKALDDVLKRLATPDSQRAAAHLLAVLGHSNSPLATLALSRQLDNPNSSAMAAQALLQQATPRALRELERRLMAEDYPHGANLLNSMLQSSNPEKIEMLYLAGNSLNPKTRQIAESYMQRWAPNIRRPEHNARIGKDRAELNVQDWAVGPAVSNEHLQNKVVLLNFWALWCEPSWTTMKHLDAWQQQYADDGLVVVSLSAYDGHGWDRQTGRSYRLSGRSKADELAAVEAFAEAHKVKHSMGVVSSREQWRAAYAVEVMPQLVLIDRDGKIQRIHVGSMEDLREFEEMLRESLSEVNMENRLLSQASLDGLTRFPLSVLNLRRAKLNTHTLQLPPLDSLATLHVDGMEIDNDSFASLLGDEDWSNIRTLTISGTQIDDRALQRLAAFPALEVLAIGCQGITDQGMQALKDCSSLKELSLGDEWGKAQISAEGLLQLLELPSLETLELNGIPLTDEAIAAIEKMPGLRSLELLGTGISMTNIERLQKSRPDVELKTDRWTDWLSHEEFQQRFVGLAQQGFVPVEIKGELRDGQERYRARFMPRPHDRFVFTAMHGNSEQQYANRANMAKANSFTLVSLSVFVTPTGDKKYSGTWVQEPYPAYWKASTGGQTDTTRDD